MIFGKSKYRNPWSWVPSLYFAEGIPYVVVMTVSVILYKRLGLSNTEIALYTSWLYLPWVIKPLWSPFIDIFKTKRWWIVIMQLIIGAGLAGVAFTIPSDSFVQYTLAFFWLLAFSSATHDIAADGFYMIGLSEHDQTFFVGIRSTFYRVAMIIGQGVLIIVAGYFETTTGLQPVDINIHSKPKMEIVNPGSPEAISFERNSAGQNLVVATKSIDISTDRTNKFAFDSTLHAIKVWNQKHGFYGAGSEPIPDLVLNETDRNKEAGNFTLLYISLNQSPEEGKEQVVTLDREGGDKSFALVEGARFTFNKNNWDKPALALVQIDHRLKTKSAAMFQVRSGDISKAWSYTFFIICGLFLAFFLYHKFILPYPDSDKAVLAGGSAKSIFGEFFKTFALFFTKEKIWLVITFLLIYRFGEAQLVKLASPFLLDPRSAGGLELTTGQVGFVYGTVGIIGLTLGGLLGGFLAAKDGLKKWIWWMFLAINIPHVLYIYLAYAQPDNFIIINLCVAGEQFGYGFGFTAYMLYMIYVSQGTHKTAHFAITTGFMALSMMIPGMLSGWIQELLGYQLFFVWILLTMIPGFIVVRMLKIDPEYGKKKKEA